MPIRGAVYVNGRITPAEDAVIPVYDHGFLYGEGIYETLRTYGGVPFLYDRHVRRLRARRRTSRLDVPFSDDALLGWINDTVAAAGEMRRGLHSRAADAGHRRAHLRRWRDPDAVTGDHRQAARRAAGAHRSPTASRVSLVSILRNHPGSVNPIIKSNNLLNNALAMQEANRRGADEGLMCNYRGELSECSQANFFIVRRGAALTRRIRSGPARGRHPGVSVRGRRGRRRRRPRRDAVPGRPGYGGRSVHHQHHARTESGDAHRRSHHRRRPPGCGHHEAARGIPPSSGRSFGKIGFARGRGRQARCFLCLRTSAFEFR